MKIETYKIRREKLSREIKSGLILLPANHLQARNYKGNPFPFRQDSSFLYFTGLDKADLVCVLDCETGKEWLAGYDPGIEDAVWSGPQKSLQQLADLAGIRYVLTDNQLSDMCKEFINSKKPIRFLPPYTMDRVRIIASLTGIPAHEVSGNASVPLIKEVVRQRSVKSDEEIEEIEITLNEVTGPMHVQAMKMARDGVYEYEIVAELYKLAKAKDLEFAYQVICSVRGETLHNESHRNLLGKDQLLLVDAGVESRNHYSSDITRTIPVGGRFSSQQREIYELVLNAQLAAIREIGPGKAYRDVHLLVARIIAQGLKEIGIMKGDTETAVKEGAHALFFPHGLGHMMGLDVHDMEDLGENFVGYSESIKRSEQFGTAYLRFAKEPEPGFILTVEPGIYFIPQLIEKWKNENLHREFINYDLAEKYFNFGGIRIEDNIVVTPAGSRILGDPIPKTVEEIEKLHGT